MTPRHMLFVALALGISWLTWMPLVVNALGRVDEKPSKYLHVVGAGGPAVAALMVSVHNGRWRALLARCFKATKGWLMVAILVPFALYIFTVAFLLNAGYAVDLEELGYSTEYPELERETYHLVAVVAYGLGGELGWRGYLLERLQRRVTAIGASLRVAVFWAVWHLPLFAFAEGLSAMGPLGVLVWIAAIFGGSFLLTAMYNASGGSVLVVTLFHGHFAAFISSPTEGPIRLAMGALVIVVGLTLPFWPGFPWTRERE